MIKLVTWDPHKKDMDLVENRRLRIKSQNFSSSKKKSQVMQVFLSCYLEWSNEVINCIKGINMLIRTDNSSYSLGVVGDQGHVSEYGLNMKLEVCGHDMVVSKLVDTCSKLCDHDVVVSLLMDTYFKLVNLDCALWVLKYWVILMVHNKLNLITSLEFLSGPSPLSRDESLLLYAVVVKESSLVSPATHKLILIVTYPCIPFNWKNDFIYHHDSQGRGESAAELTVVFPLCGWDGSNGEGPRNSTIGLNMKLHYHDHSQVFLVIIHYLHCVVNVIMKPVLWMIGNYGARVNKHYDAYALPEFEYFLLDDMFELNRSIEDLGAQESSNSIILKKHLILDMNRKILEKNIALTLLFFIHRGNYPKVVMIYDIIIPLRVEVSNCICDILFAARLFEGSLFSFMQWNPGYKDLILSYYCTERVLMQIVARAVLLVINFLEMEKSYATSNTMMFASTKLNSSTMRILWDPEKFNACRTKVAFAYQCCCLRNSLSLLNFVYDRGKIWLKSIWVLLVLVYDRGKFWSSNIWVQVKSGFSVYSGSTLADYL